MTDDGEVRAKETFFDNRFLFSTLGIDFHSDPFIPETDTAYDLHPTEKTNAPVEESSGLASFSSFEVAKQSCGNTLSLANFNDSEGGEFMIFQGSSNDSSPKQLSNNLYQSCFQKSKDGESEVPGCGKTPCADDGLTASFPCDAIKRVQFLDDESNVHHSPLNAQNLPFFPSGSAFRGEANVSDIHDHVESLCKALTEEMGLLKELSNSAETQCISQGGNSCGDSAWIGIDEAVDTSIQENANLVLRNLLIYGLNMDLPLQQTSEPLHLWLQKRSDEILRKLEFLDQN